MGNHDRPADKPTTLPTNQDMRGVIGNSKKCGNYGNICTRKEDFFLLFVLLIKTEGKKEEESVESLCASISPVDKANAEKPGTDYETEIGDDCKQQQS